MEGYRPELLDPDTVNELETLIPHLSLHDRAIIQDRMRRRRIFRKLESDNDRILVLERITKVSGRVLSFYTFTRDFIYFEACMIALKSLQPEGYRGTMSEAFLESYMRDQTGLYNVQVAEDVFERRDEDGDGMNICYRQLFLAVMRDFPSLTGLRPYQDDKKGKAKTSGVPSERLINLAQLAIKLGFKNDEIMTLHTHAAASRYQIVTEEFLNQLQPLDRYHIDTETNMSVAQNVSDRISNTSAIRMPIEEAELTTDLEKLPKKFRCSRPSYKRYLSDRQLLFLGNIYQQDVVPRSHATSFAIQRDIFLSFFGEINPHSQETEDELFSSPDSSENSYHGDMPESYDTQSWENEGNHTNTNELQDAPQDETEHQEHESSGDFDSRLSESLESDDPLNQPQARQSRADSWETHSISTLSNFWAVDEQLKSLDPLMTPSSFLNDLLSQTDDILLYFWQTRQYTQLSSRPQDEHLFDSKTRLLANQHQMFISISRTKPHLVLPRDLYDTAMREKLILVGPKHDRMGLSRSLMSQPQNRIFGFLDIVNLRELIA
ncbi:hypothetical protein N7471_008348 [Penicillium samsonianum]|uniref:uncharacterized protein n=1 Tax=Penicillium samsonianum TaxID=1882272 RepID=UPI002546685D|nr:uncharacterized protein N7471_008348 [Penicillium samsonianum]KAJ6133133.1 hypothetical protein N7471_008348 [Penicillium samsonianum]